MFKEASRVPDRLLTIEEARERLNTSRASIYVLMESGALPFVYLGARRRVRESDLDTYIGSLSIDNSEPIHTVVGREARFESVLQARQQTRESGGRRVS